MLFELSAAVVRTAVPVIVTGPCVRAVMQYAVRYFMRLRERSVPYIIVAGFRMVPL